MPSSLHHPGYAIRSEKGSEATRTPRVEGASVRVVSALTLLLVGVIVFGLRVHALQGSQLGNVNLTTSQTSSSPAANSPGNAPKSSSSHVTSLSTNSSVVTPQSNSQPDVTTDLQVNGKRVSVPANGTVHKEVHTNDGKTTVIISVNSNSSTSADSSLDLDVQSSTNSTSDSSP